jgi:hypothetical protein
MITNNNFLIMTTTAIPIDLRQFRPSSVTLLKVLLDTGDIPLTDLQGLSTTFFWPRSRL